MFCYKQSLTTGINDDNKENIPGRDRFRAQWYKENKPHGFNVQDIRLGGLIMRMTDCRDRLNDFLSGAVGCIPELEEERLPLENPRSRVNNWASTVTADVL